MNLKYLYFIFFVISTQKTIAQYTTPNINTGTSTNNKFFISNFTLDAIKNPSLKFADTYTYYHAISPASLQLGATYTGSITFETFKANNAVSIKIWIDYSGDGTDFIDASEEIFSYTSSSHPQTTTKSISFTVPTSFGYTGTTRLRIALKDNRSDASAPTPTTIGSEDGEYEDYNIYLTPGPFESAIISQVYHSGINERWIEISNVTTSEIAANTLILALYQNKTGDQTGILPDQEYTISTAIPANSSILIRKNTSALITHSGIPIEEANITDFTGGDDIIIITDIGGSNAWINRYDMISNIENETSYIRNDHVTTYNTTYTSSEWTAFVDDSLDPYSSPPERHPNAPLLSEIASSNSTSNIRLGIHQHGSTNRIAGNWSNGTPDRSREVIINENYEHTGSSLKAKNLSINTTSKLTITNNPLIVSDNININSTAEIRLSGTSQLIQTHDGTNNVSGTGNLYIDQNSPTASVYRYNYFSSPVNTPGTSNYSVADVMKDGTISTSASSTPPNIIFDALALDGSTGPLTIAEQWIYTYASNASNVSNFIQKSATKAIAQTDGFTMKGPGISQNYTFVGTPKDGQMTTSIGAGQSYLLGNPYPSAISAKKFIEDNLSAIDGSIYLWEHVGEDNPANGHQYSGYYGGYATLTTTMGLSADNVTLNNTLDNGTPRIGTGSYTTPLNYIPVGQGFFVSGEAIDGGTIEFNNSQRENITEGASSVFLKTRKIKYLNQNKTKDSNKLPILKLGMDYIGDNGVKYHSQIGVSFSNHNSFDYEPGYDAFSYNNNRTNFNWKFENSQKKYVIAGVPAITDHLEVPFELTMGYNGEVTFDLDEWQNINREVYLLDKSTDQTQPLDNGKATLYLNKETYSNRFAITFTAHETLTSKEIINQSIHVLYEKESNKINIYNLNKLSILNMKLYNSVGQVIGLWNKSNKAYLKQKLPADIYILKLRTNKGNISKKIIIY